MRSGGPQENDTDTTMLLAAFLVVVVVVGIWMMFHEEIATVVVVVKGAQARLVAQLGITDYLDGVLVFLDQTPPADMSPSHLEQVSRHVGTVTRWVLSPILVVLAIAAVKWMPSGLFRGPMKLDDLLRFQSLMWPAVRPVVDFNPGRQGAAKRAWWRGKAEPRQENPSWARALRPLDWLKVNGITLETDGSFDPEKVEKAFAAQLGEPWEGLGHLPAHLQGLFVAFALAATFERKKEAESLLGTLDTIWQEGTAEEAVALTREALKPFLGDKKLLGPAVAQANRHAWVSTAMASLMRWAIDGGGILNSGLFVWLRGVDRRTWYALNNVGRATYHIEGAGSMCHLMAEEAAGGPIETPEVENAIEGLIEYLDERGKLGE